MLGNVCAYYVLDTGLSGLHFLSHIDPVRNSDINDNITSVCISNLREGNDWPTVHGTKW